MRIWSLPFDAATGQIRGTIQPVTAKGMNAALSDLSRDGKKLSFDSWRTGKHEFWEKSLEDDREKLLATEDNGMHAGAWSRDGTRLVGHRQSHFTPDESRIRESTIVIYPAGGGYEQALTSPTTSLDYGTDWSADDQWVLATANPLTAGRSEIRLLPVAAAPHAETQARILTTSEEFNIWQARFSPNERWVSFNAVNKVNKTLTSTIYLIPVSGGEWTRVTEGEYWGDEPRWSPDGRILYFSSNRTGFPNVWGIHFNSPIGSRWVSPFGVHPSFWRKSDFLLFIMDEYQATVCRS